VNLITELFNQNKNMKKIAYQTPVIKTLTSEVIMQGASQRIHGEGGGVDAGYGGIDPGVDPEAKDGYKSHSVWDD